MNPVSEVNSSSGAQTPTPVMETSNRSGIGKILGVMGGAVGIDVKPKVVVPDAFHNAFSSAPAETLDPTKTPMPDAVVSAFPAATSSEVLDPTIPGSPVVEQVVSQPVSVENVSQPLDTPVIATPVAEPVSTLITPELIPQAPPVPETPKIVPLSMLEKKILAANPTAFIGPDGHIKREEISQKITDPQILEDLAKGDPKVANFWNDAKALGLSQDEGFMKAGITSLYSSDSELPQAA